MNVPDQRLTRLDEHQSAILDILRRSERLLKAPERDAPALARERWELARALLAYQGFVNREVFDPLIASGGPRRAPVARRLKADCAAAGEAFRAHVAKWSAAGVLDRWAEYQPATLALIARLRDQLARERRDGAALLAG